MIIVKGRELLIPANERYIGTNYDAGMENRLFRIPRYSQSGTDLSDLTFKINLIFEGDPLDRAEMTKAVDDDYIYLTWTVTEAQVAVTGTVFVCVTGNDTNDTVKWSSFQAPFYTEKSLGDDIDTAYHNLVNRLDTEATTRQNADNTLQQNINAEAAARAAADAAANTRIDNIVAQSGDDITEIVDARVGADGTTHTVLKNRLDAENSQLKNKLLSNDYSSATILPNGTDLNDVTTPGNYRVTSTSNANTMSNIPMAVAFRLFVFTTTDSEKEYQVVFTNASSEKKMFIRNWVNVATGWTAWKQVAFADDVSTNIANTAKYAEYKTLIRNILPMLTTRTQTHSGVTFKQEDDYSFTISGSITSPATYAQQNIYYDRSALPSWIKTGKYRARLVGAVDGIQLHAYAYTDNVATTLFLSSGDDGFYDFEILSSYDGFAIYLRATKDFATPVNVKPIVFSKEAIENFNLDDLGGVIAQNLDREADVIQVKAVRGVAYNSDVPVVSFVHFSDIHAKQDLWNRVAQFANYYKQYLDFSILTGDYANDNVSNYVDLIGEGTPFLKPCYMCVGNHDTYANSNHDLTTKSTTYDILFQDASAWTDVVFEPITDSMSYYKDFAASNLRIIVLDQYFDTAIGATWLASILADAKTNGMYVATFMHTPTARITNPVDCTFMTLDDESSAWGTSPFESAIASFISDGGKYVANFCGHWHRNYIGYTANNVLNIVVPAATTYANFNDSDRENGTRSYDCFNVVGIDTNLNLIKIVRIGNNADHYLRQQNVLTYDFANNRVIANA